jgi:hypothetical protein
MLNRYEIQFSQWKLKPDVSDSIFRVEFPKGLIVTDMRRPNQGYIVGGLDDPNTTNK